jgi:glycerol-3-phosphate dehydrogenase (NAD(P)+)
VICTVLGNGGFGTAFALLSHRAGHRVRLWGHDPEYTAELARTRQNPRYLPGVELPREVQVGADAKPALARAEVVVLAIPTQHLRSVLTAVQAQVPRGVPVLSLAKGLEQGTALRPSEVAALATGGRNPVLALSGPSHAEEVARDLPTAVVLAGSDDWHAARLQDQFATPRFRIYRHRDLLGVEIAGALKNVIALAAGIAEGLGFGDNSKAALLSRGIVEIARYGRARGAEPETFFGLAGVGDLAVTAFSVHGRNRAFGVRIGRGETLAQILSSERRVAEGVWTSRVVRDQARSLGIEMPICEAVCGVLHEGLPAPVGVQRLMERDPKSEELG